MLFWPSLAVCVLFFFGVLFVLWLCAIDLKLRLLPDELTAALAVTGMLFRWAAAPYAGPWFDAGFGMLAGAGALLLVRAIANKIYGFETMGLGDVKLMGAGGLWLGLEGAMMALCVGAFAGVAHGMGHIAHVHRKTGERPEFRGLSIPAGPGFCFGLIAVAVWRYHNLPLFGAS